MPSMARVCLECLEAFKMPTALNMYITAAGQQVSAPPHTDKQDVFVIQTQGQKRWRVYTPPPPSRLFRADPFARGKGTDTLEMSELGPPLIDVVLSPGQILYVPAGFPHTTDTTFGIAPDADASLHLTVGIDTHIWSLNYAGLREMSLRRSNIADKLQLTKAPGESYWDMQGTLPVGFLHGTHGDIVALIKQRHIQLLRVVEETKWKDASDEAVAEALHLEECVAKVITHHQQMTEIFRAMYSDVAYKLSATKVDISFLRSKPYFEALDATMGKLIEWSKSFPQTKANEEKGSKRVREPRKQGRL